MKLLVPPPNAQKNTDPTKFLRFSQKSYKQRCQKHRHEQNPKSDAISRTVSFKDNKIHSKEFSILFQSHSFAAAAGIARKLGDSCAICAGLICDQAGWICSVGNQFRRGTGKQRPLAYVTPRHKETIPYCGLTAKGGQQKKWRSVAMMKGISSQFFIPVANTHANRHSI